MNYDIIGAATAAVTGLFIAFINYLISKKVLIKAPEKFSLITVVRQVIQVGYIVAVYFIGDAAGIEKPAYLLVGAVLGMTLPMLLFTKKLLAVNESRAAEAKEKGKEDETDG